MTTPLIWEELFALPSAVQVQVLANEDSRRAPDRALWRCVSCNELSKRARTTPDRLCAVCVSPGPEAPTAKKPVRRRRARRAKR